MMFLDERIYNIITFLSSLFEWAVSIIFINSVVKKKASKPKFVTAFAILFVFIVAIKILNYIVAGEMELQGQDTLLIRFICKFAVVLFSFFFIITVYKFTSTNALTIVLPVLMLCTSNIFHILIKFLSQLIATNYLVLFAAIFIGILDCAFATTLYFASKTINKAKLIYYKKDVRIIIFSFTVSLIILAFFNIILLHIRSFILDEFLVIIISVIAVLAMDIIIMKLILRTATLNRIQKENELKLIGQSLEQQYAKSIKEQAEIFRRMRHDFKHHMNVIDALLDSNNLDEAKKYIKKYLDSIDINSYIHTENEYINAILNSKITLAKRRGINVTSVIAGDTRGVDNVDMCNLLGNLLDNAIEGCCDTEEKSIVIKIVVEEQIIRISVSNSISHSVLSENAELKTSKADAENHGFGTKSIKEIANRYNGFADYFEENNKLFANITLVKESEYLARNS